jgi:hypothetical protein
MVEAGLFAYSPGEQVSQVVEPGDEEWYPDSSLRCDTHNSILAPAAHCEQDDAAV